MENTAAQPNSTKIVPRVIEEEMKQAYVNYAMSVIVGRALPDIRDGLKPVHRRILFAMYELGMFHNKPFKKCARIVGEVLGKFHPHGDTAVYDSLVRMAQDFSLRYPLIKGQGNFGSIDGDSAAAMRYTEAKLSKIAEEMLHDIEKNTVSFRDNFDGSLKEPEVLPSKIPNLLLNGSSGIAVGMATNVPPHNLREICDGIIATIDNPQISLQELMTLIPGPDFPTGGEVLCGSALLSAYGRGRGKVTIKAICSVEDDKIIVTQIPYQVNKEELIEQIADLVRDKIIPGIRNINDESDQEGIRIVIDLKRENDPAVILNQLYQFSRLKISFGITMLALVKGQPLTLGLKDFIVAHIDHRKDVIVKRTQYDLDQAEQRVHILEGLLIALAHIEEIIAGIKKSRAVDDAQTFLISTYTLTVLQAKAILELRLQKLASLEQQKIQEEHLDLLKQIAAFREILASEAKVLSLIKEEITIIKENYADQRKSIIVPSNEEEEDLNMEELIEEQTVVVTLTQTGYLKRLPLDTYRTQKRGGKGIIAAGMKEEDVVDNLYVTSTHAFLLVLTDKGQLHWLKVYQIPQGTRQAKGKHISNLLTLQAQEKITAIIPVRSFDDGYLFMATKQGTVKKTPLTEFSRPRVGGIRALTLDENDTLIGVEKTTGNDEMILATKEGAANRFHEEDVRAMGRTAAGVRGIRLDANDEVIGMLIAAQDKNILTITQKGYGKQTPVSDYRLCNRGGKGVTNIKITDKNGPVKAVMNIAGNEELMLVSKQGIAIRMKTSDISVIGRATQGVRLMRLNDTDELAAAAKVDSDEAVVENIVVENQPEKDPNTSNDPPSA